MNRVLAAVTVLLVLGGCASVNSRPQASRLPPAARTPAGTPLQDGLTYWMPRRDIVVSISLGEEPADDAKKENPKPPKEGKGDAAGDGGQAKEAQKPGDAAKTAPAPGSADGDDGPKEPPVPESPVIKISASSPYADTSRAYVALFSRNLIGKNQLTIQVSDRGLLNSAKSETTSELSQIFSAIATAAGSAYAASYSGGVDTCPKKVSLVLRVDPSQRDNFIDVPNASGCRVHVVVKAPAIGVVSNARDEDTVHPHSGFFYKQNLPYTVTVTYSQWTATDVVLLPNASPVQFLPVERSLFANNVSDLTFSDGVLTKYGQTVDGEALAVAKLPADILKAYFGAVGAMFTLRKDATTNEAAYLDALLALTKKQLASEACLAAYRSGDADRIATDCH